MTRIRATQKRLSPTYVTIGPMLRRLWRSVVGLVRKPEPSPEELAERIEAEAELQRAKDKWLADEARQSRQVSGTGPGI
jgi:hypothetical protein